jgi:hypothetical protein
MDYRKFWRVWDWICLALDRDWRQAVVNTLMNPWVHKNLGNFLSSRVIVRFLRTLLQGISNQ